MQEGPDVIYLDYHATTPCDPRVVDAMLPYFSQTFGNPASAMHMVGRKAAMAVEAAREQVAHLIGAQRGEIVFTSGATESNNLVIGGAAKVAPGKKRRIVTTSLEHKSVLLSGRELARQSFDLVVLPVDQEGRVSLGAAKEAIDDQTLLVSVQAASNEIGTIQQVAEIAHLAREHGALMHTDAAQAVGKIPVDVVEWGVDFLSISAHKLYGPKGVGALYVRGGPHNQSLAPLVYGGGQEWGLRSGTLNVPGIVGLGEACRLCTEWLERERYHIVELRDTLEQSLLRDIPGLRRNGALDNRLPNNASLTFSRVDAEALLANLPGLALSAGSACTSGALEPSHVLLALGLSRVEAYSTLRIGLGRFTTRHEIEYAAKAIAGAYKRLLPLAK